MHPKHELAGRKSLKLAELGRYSIGLPEDSFRIRQIVREAELIARHVELDVGGIEYLVDDRDGEHYFYDINALSNFVADPVNVIGFDPFERLVDYLVERTRVLAPAGFLR